MTERNTIMEHAEVLGSDGVHVGMVDAIEGHRIKLTKSDANDTGQTGHHFLATALVADVKGKTVTLTVPAAEALATQEDA